MSAKKQTPVRKSLNRQTTLLGVERVPVAFLILITCILIFSGMTFVTIALGILIFIVGIYSLRQMAIAHPLMTKVFLRNIKYKEFYPARVTHRAPEPHRSVIEKTRRMAL